MSKATREARMAEIAGLQRGVGVFVLRNITKSDLILPKLSLDNPPRRQIGPGGRFLGDSYHLDNMHGMLVVDQVISSGDEVSEPASAPAPNEQAKTPPQVADLDAAGMLSEES